MTLFNSPFLPKLIYLAKFNSVSIFNGFILLVRIYTIKCTYSLSCVFIFDFCLQCLMSNLLGFTYICYVGRHFGCYKHSLLERIILFNPCLMDDLLYVISECFEYVACICLFRKGIIYMHPLVPTSEKIIYVGLKIYHFIYCLRQRR